MCDQCLTMASPAWYIPDGTSLGHCAQNGGFAHPPSGGGSEALLRTGMSTLMSLGMSSMSSGPTGVGTVSQVVGSSEDAHGSVMTSHMTGGGRSRADALTPRVSSSPPPRSPFLLILPTYKVRRIEKATSCL